MTPPKLSIVIPALNEAENLPTLITRLAAVLSSRQIEYEILIVNDRSTDNTEAVMRELSDRYPVRLLPKQGKPGKAYSLLEGFAAARGELIAMIDADLQYPPEALPEMIAKLEQGFDFVVANRRVHKERFWRKAISKLFSLFFIRILHGLPLDSQSGLKVFKRSLLREIELHPTEWTFDLEFLIKAREAGHWLGSHDIVFEKRRAGASKINMWRASMEIGLNAIRLKFAKLPPVHIVPTAPGSMQGAGVAHKRRRFITHTTLPHQVSALKTLVGWQKVFGLFLLAVIAAGFYLNPQLTAIILVASLSVIYFLDVLFNLYLVTRSLSAPPEISFSDEALAALDEATLPVYTILCPLFREARILPNILEAIGKLDWPKERLDLILLLEKDDHETIAAAGSLDLPPYARVAIVPDSQPKTKPKACNYGLSLARGEYLVIYDAEDVPDPQQLKKAFLAFQRVGPEVKCLQAKLNYYNPHHNLLTRLFTAEYSLWFDVILTGLQSVNTYIPLGGTSNHFRTRDLHNWRGWDPFNVTEDCDLGARLFIGGGKTAIIDSVTLEEANSRLGNWLKQRSRWIKGYIQTYLVHNRAPLEFWKRSGWHAIIFQLVVGGKIAFLLINPILWLATISYFALNSLVGPTIEALYPAPVFYVAATSLIFGNFLYLYYYMIGAVKRRHWALVKYVFLIPVYWFFASIAALLAVGQLLYKPHYWEKTKHGLYAPRPVDSVSSRFGLIPRVLDLRRRVAGAISTRILAGGGALVAMMMIANFLNFVFNAYLGRALNFENLGLLTLVNTLWFLTSIFLGALATTVTHSTAYLTAAGKPLESTQLRRFITRKSLLISGIISAAWVALSPLISGFFNVSNPLILLSFTSIFSVGAVLSVNRGYLNGALRFSTVGLLFLAEAGFKLIGAGILIRSGFERLVYLVIPASVALAAGISLLFIRTNHKPAVPRDREVFPAAFYWAALVAGISTTLFLSLDILLVKHYMTAQLAGEYALLALVGKMVFFFGSLPAVFIMSLVGRDLGLGKSPARTFRLLFTLSLLLTGAAVFALGPMGYSIVPVLLGSKTLSILQYLNVYVLGIAAFTLSSVIVVYHLARKQYEFTVLSFLTAVVMAVGIVVYHGTVGEIGNVIFWTSMVGLGLVGLAHIYEEQFGFLKRVVVDFFDIFSGAGQASALGRGKKRVLVFNWRDNRHVFAGGAEVYVHEIAKRWVRKGHSVTVFCGNDGKSPRNEFVDGVEIIRRGGFYFVYIWAFVYYLVRFRGRYDLVIDCENGIPFFTPFYVKETVVCLMHHVHQEVFRRSLAWPFSWFARFLERDLMPLVYRKVRFITVSESSRKEIVALGLAQAGIEVVHPGVDLQALTPGEKSAEPTILYLGRLKAYKSIDVLIRAFEKIVKLVPQARLIIAGSGEEGTRLERLAGELKLQKFVQFMGQVSEEQKVRLLQKSWVFVNPSMMEGWGITTIEANACGVPVVASDVPGLRDSVQNPHTGYLVRHGDHKLFAEKIIQLIKDENLRAEMSRDAVAWSREFDWQKSADKAFEFIKLN